MKRSGAWLAVRALEQIGVRFTFGIPGVHNTELYDELGKSESITPVLVTHECGAAFMADAVSRTSDSIGTLAIVPAAGVTHAMSGIGEAYLDGIPMLILSGGVRRDSGRSFQLHQIDQERLVAAVVKRSYLIRDHAAIVPTLYQAHDAARHGVPGPVFVELPGEVQMFRGEAAAVLEYEPMERRPPVDLDSIQRAAKMLASSTRPGIYVGWGAVDAAGVTSEIAEWLGAPVATTLQGLSAFPATHRLHTGMGFGPSSVPAAEKAFGGCDCLLAVGVRFSELATGSYGMDVPPNLIHIDIDEEVIGRNYPAAVPIVADARDALPALLQELQGMGRRRRDPAALAETIRTLKDRYRALFEGPIQSGRVSPGHFFRELRARLRDDAIVVVDDGKHTFLTVELFPVRTPRAFLSPSDFNCMGYCVPATIGAKIANPERQVVGVVGDGAFLMTGLEMLTASTYNLGIPYFVFHDGELGQISRFQKIPLNRKTCTILGDIKLEGIAQATGAAYLPLSNDADIGPIIDRALDIATSGQPVVVDVKIDYSVESRFSKGVVRTNLGRFPLGEKFRFIGRAIWRHVAG